jgi:hypothetical protein
MTLLDRILLRKAECAAIIDALRRDGRADSARVVEARMHTWADALTEARDAGAALAPAAEIQPPRDWREAFRAADPVPAPGATSSPVERVAPSVTAPVSGHPSLPPLLRPLDTPANAADAPPAPAARRATGRRPGTATTWTADRAALLARLYSTPGLKRPAMLDQLNALPGPPVLSVEAVKTQAKKLGLVRAQAAPAAPPAPAPPPQLQPQPATGSAIKSKPPEDIDEARQMMRSGKVGAKALSDYFGWSLPEAQSIAAELREAIEAEAPGRAA